MVYELGKMFVVLRSKAKYDTYS